MGAVVRDLHAAVLSRLGRPGDPAARGSLLANRAALAALIVTIGVATFVAKQLFRWEKEQVIKPAAKAWVAAALVPFVLLGLNDLRSHEQRTRTQTLFRDVQRQSTFLIRGCRIFVGDGRVIESGAVLVRGGKIAEVYDGEGPDAQSLKAEVVEAAGKTVLPGLIDVHVHLGAPGGFFADPAEYASADAMPRALAQYLYSGVTTVKSAGDALDRRLPCATGSPAASCWAPSCSSPARCSPPPAATAPSTHRYVPANFRASFEAQIARTPKTADEARQFVSELKASRVDGLKAILEAGFPGRLFERLDSGI